MGTFHCRAIAGAILAIWMANAPVRPAVAQAPASPSTDSTAGEDAILRKADALSWQTFPANADLASKAQLALDKNIKYLPPSEADKFLQLMGNLPSTNSYLVSTTDYRWFAVFHFDPSGYVRDNEKIDPDALLKLLRQKEAEDDAERKKRGLPGLHLIGWSVPPHYDTATHQLEWGTKLEDDDHDVSINYTVRLLSRSGVMSTILVSDPVHIDDDITEFRGYLAKITFNQQENYSEFKPGDKVAEYGLAALVVGGASAVAVKSAPGLFKAAWLAIVAAIAGVGAVLKAAGSAVARLFGGKKKQG